MIGETFVVLFGNGPISQAWVESMFRQWRLTYGGDSDGFLGRESFTGTFTLILFG
jgi:hypothetical protein